MHTVDSSLCCVENVKKLVYHSSLNNQLQDPDKSLEPAFLTSLFSLLQSVFGSAAPADAELIEFPPQTDIRYETPPSDIEGSQLPPEVGSALSFLLDQEYLTKL